MAQAQQRHNILLNVFVEGTKIVCQRLVTVSTVTFPPTIRATKKQLLHVTGCLHFEMSEYWPPHRISVSVLQYSAEVINQGAWLDQVLIVLTRKDIRRLMYLVRYFYLAMT
jgi:hypothetical protein